MKLLKLNLCLSVLFFVFVTKMVAFANSDYYIETRSVPEEHKKAFEFLELLKFPGEPKTTFDPQKSPHWNTSKLLSFISSKGILFYDVNDSGEKSLDKSHIESQLNNREGDAFTTFAHLSYIYSIPYKQYSELLFEKTNNNLFVYIGNWYRITFEYADGKPYVVKCDYMQVEGD